MKAAAVSRFACCALALAVLAVPAWAAGQKDPSERECVISGGAAPWGSRGLRKAGEKFTVKADPPAREMAFVEWVGNVECLADPKAAEKKGK